jgi:hypothetical protein
MASLAPSQLPTVIVPRRAPRKKRPAPTLYRLALALVGLLAIGLFVYGYDYYRLDLAERVHHTEFRALHPSGKLGYLYGVLGSCLLVFNLTYLLRRKLPRWRLGSMPAWLDAHVVSGLGAYVLVAFHSAFQQRTLLASGTFWSLTVVALTGLVGRYLKALTPRPELERLEGNLIALDAISSGLGSDIRRRLLLAPPTDIGAAPSLARCLGTLPAWRNDARARTRTIDEAVDAAYAENPHALLAEISMVTELLDETAQLALQDVCSVAATALLRSWRSLHRFLAIMMMTTVVVHIATAWSFGYRWIWSQ